MAEPDKVSFKAEKFNVTTQNSLGIYHKDLKVLAKEIGTDSILAMQLFESNLYEGKLLCSKIFDPKDITDQHLDQWIASFDNWEICDSYCLALFAKNELAVSKINYWASLEKEFEKRTAFATMAGYCMADKKASNEVFEAFFPLIIGASDDNRIYVKKAVNWALRNIGKRNVDLKKSAMEVAYQLLNSPHKSAQWIAKDALKEFEKPNCRMSDYPRHIYRK